MDDVRKNLQRIRVRGWRDAVSDTVEWRIGGQGSTLAVVPFGFGMVRFLITRFQRPFANDLG